MPWRVLPFFLQPTRLSEPSGQVEATGIELASLGNASISNGDIDSDTVMTDIQPQHGPSPLGERKRRRSDSVRQNHERLTKRANVASTSVHMESDLGQTTNELEKMEENFRSTLHALHLKHREFATRLHDLQRMANTLKKYVDDLVVDSA